MYPAGIFVFLGILVVVLGETMQDEAELVAMIKTCAKENNLTPGDMAFDENIKNPSNDMLCFMKCIAEHDGSLDENGKIIQEHMDKFLKAMKFNDSVIEEVKKCTENVPAIKECKDMKGLSDCFPGFP